MKTVKIAFVIFLCTISDVFGLMTKSTLTRVKRWKDGGDMGTGDMSNMFRGTAGVDYPDYKTIPNTNFRCEDQIYEGGLYADIETNCQVYHVCHDGRKDSFLCGRGTIFNQQILACDYWYSAECDTAPNYYYLNAEIGKSGSPNNLQDNYSQYGNNQGYPDSTGNNHRGSVSGNVPQYDSRGASVSGNVPQYDSHRASVSGNVPQYDSHGAPVSGNVPQYDNHGQQPCQCFKNSYKTSWSFPTGMMHGQDK